MSNSRDSRRQFLLQAAGLVIPTVSGVRLKLVQEFANALLLAVSPDGKRVCLYFDKHPQETFNWRGGFWKHDNTNAGIVLRVTELSSGKTVHSAKPRQKTWRASFFRDGERLYAETLAFRNGAAFVSQQLVIDLQDGTTQEHLRPEHPEQASVYCVALQDRIVLATEADGKTRRVETLIRMQLPEYTTLTRAPFPVRSEREQFGWETGVVISVDRKTFAYGTDHTIVYRSTEDLSVIWTRRIEDSYFGVWRVAISANQSRVAAAVIDTAFIEQQRKFYVGIYDAGDGSPLARLEVNGTEGIDISPDGRLLAVGERIQSSETPETELAVSLYDISIGQPVARVVHDRFRIRPHEGINSHFGLRGIQFTPDGRYLLTSSIRTKVWEFEG